MYAWLRGLVASIGVGSCVLCLAFAASAQTAKVTFRITGIAAGEPELPGTQETLRMEMITNWDANSDVGDAPMFMCGDFGSPGDTTCDCPLFSNDEGEFHEYPEYAQDCLPGGVLSENPTLLARSKTVDITDGPTELIVTLNLSPGQPFGYWDIDEGHFSVLIDPATSPPEFEPRTASTFGQGVCGFRHEGDDFPDDALCPHNDFFCPTSTSSPQCVEECVYIDRNWEVCYTLEIECVPQPETCDNADNDCDNEVDEGLSCPSEVGPPWQPLGPRPLESGIGGLFNIHTADPASGRATMIGINPQNPYNVWLGTASGGLWVTGDARIGGLSKSFTPGDPFDLNWSPQFFPFPVSLGSHAIGSVVIDQNSCSSSGCGVVYVGTGENSLRRDTYHGDGVFRLTHQGGAWGVERLDATNQFRYGSIAKMLLDSGELFVAVHPGNTTTAVHANVRAPEPMAGYGIHKFAGGTWTRLFEVDAVGTEDWANLRIPTDIVKHPSLPNTFFVGVMNDGVYRTDNRGLTFCAMNEGAVLHGLSGNDNITDCSDGSGLPPAGSFDHVRLAPSPLSGSETLFLLLGNCPSGFGPGLPSDTDDFRGAIFLCKQQVPHPMTGLVTLVERVPFLFRSTNGGTAWAPIPAPYQQFELDPDSQTLVTSHNSNSHYSRYTNALTAVSDTQVLYGGISSYVLTQDASTGGDAGPWASVRLRNSVHPDFHHFALAPFGAVSAPLYAANDGGFYFFDFKGSTEWKGGNETLVTTAFYGIGIDRTPDNGQRTLGILGGLQDNGVVAFNGGRQWEVWRGGDGAESIVQTPLVTYNSIQANSVERRPGGGTAPTGSAGGAHPPGATGDDMAFVVPYVQHDATKRLYVATSVVSIRAGDEPTWAAGTPPSEIISPVLGTGGLNFPAVESRRNLMTALEVSDSDEWRIYVGMYDGSVFRSVGGSKPTPTTAAWPDVTGNLPRRTISSIAVHPTNPNDVWVTISDFLDGPQTVWHSTTGGMTWTQSGPPNAVRFDPANVIKFNWANPSELWLGTDQTVWSKTGESEWVRRNANLPTVPVFDIEVDPFTNRVFAATHGRGVWMLPLGGPVLTTFLGCTETNTGDNIPIHGNGFTCANPGDPRGCPCTVEVLREDGTPCAGPSSVDAQGNEVFVPPGSGELTTEDVGSCATCEGRPVAWACFDGVCVGGVGIDSCNQGGHVVSGVRVTCEGNPAADGSVAGTCPERSDPPSVLFEVVPRLEENPPPSPSQPEVVLRFAPSIPAGDSSPGEPLCVADVGFDPNWTREDIHIGVRNGINQSPSCVQAGVSSSILALQGATGEDATKDLRLALSAPTVTANRLVMGIGARPGEADRTCLRLTELGSLLGAELGSMSVRFITAPGGANGGFVAFEERSPVGTCAFGVSTTPGQEATEVAEALAQAFDAPGTPSPATCAESRNSRDLLLEGDVIHTSLASGLELCISDSGIGFTIGPRGVDVPIDDADFEDMALYASDSLKLGDRARIRESNGSGGIAASAGTSLVKHDSVLGDLFSVGSVTLLNRVHVQGLVKTGATVTFGSQVTVDDGVFQGATVRLPDLRHFAVGFPPTNQGPISVPVSGTLSRSPGSYSQVTLAPNSTLQIASGTYFFKTLTMEPGSRLELNQTNGPVYVYVRDVLVFRGQVAAAGGAQPNLLMVYLGTGTGLIERPFAGTLAAPNARLHFLANNLQVHRGAFFARHLEFEPDAIVEHVPFDLEFPLAAPAASCSDGIRNGDESDVDCGGGCGATCGVGASCRADQDCTSGDCSNGVCQGPPGGCTEANAVDLGPPGANLTISNAGCLRVRDGYPSWWGTRNMQLQTTTPGAYPVPFTWSNACTGASGSDTLTGDWQSRVFGPTSAACATLIDLLGPGNGSITVRYYAN